MKSDLCLHDYLEYYAALRGDDIFLSHENRHISYADSELEANRIARALLSMGVSKGDRFAYLSKNSPEMLLMFFAASKIGAIPVPLNYRLAPSEWAFIIDDAAAELIIVSGDYIAGIDKVRTEIPKVKHFVSMASAPQNNWLDNWLDYGSLVSQQSSEPVHDEVGGDDVLFQMYTSGTTGKPKGVMLSQRSVLTNLAQSRLSVEHPPGRGMRSLICTPMYHVAAVMTCFSVLTAGLTLIIHTDFCPHSVVESLHGDGISYVNLVPSMIQAMLTQVPDVKDKDYSKLVAMTYGASPIAEQTLRQAMAVFGCEFFQMFGLTECSGSLTCLNHDDHMRALKEKPELLLSCGKPLIGTKIRLLNDFGDEAADGEVGEIVVRGPQTMLGYWNRQEDTDSTIKDNWLYTGDAAVRDAEGYLYIRDRMKEVIVSGAENIYPREIENVLFNHSAIADVAVIGIPDDRFGEAVLAAVAVKEGCSISKEELIDYCREYLGGYKIPRHIDFLSALPRNASGKVMKNQLREPYWKHRNRAVG